MQRIGVYGIKACDTMKKARAWLDAHGVDHVFHDYKVEGIDRETLERWVSEAGWEVILNRNGTTFRGLPEAEKSEIGPDNAIRLMQSNPSMIKRPVIEGAGALIVGFKPEVFARVFGHS